MSDAFQIYNSITKKVFIKNENNKLIHKLQKKIHETP